MRYNQIIVEENTRMLRHHILTPSHNLSVRFRYASLAYQFILRKATPNVWYAYLLKEHLLLIFQNAEAMKYFSYLTCLIKIATP
jgi:hypothetical protein